MVPFSPRWDSISSPTDNKSCPTCFRSCSEYAFFDMAVPPFLPIYKQFTTALDELGVTVIEAVGKEFDPNLHNAVMHVEDEEAGENIVVEEFLKGYMYKGSVVRHSMVKVAN